MERYDFGSLRFIEIYTTEEEAGNSGFYNYMKAFRMAGIGPALMIVTGSVNGMEPILVYKDANQSDAVFVFDAQQKQLIQIADNRKHLHVILDFLLDIWQNTPGTVFLEKTKANVRLYEEFKQQLSHHPKTDTGYWLQFAFREFIIRIDI